MRTDDHVALATQLAEQLVDVERNEWKKWTEYLKCHGDIERALALAKQLSRSPMLRTGPQNAHRKIYEVITKHKPTLTRFTQSDLYQLLGFVGWCLVGRLGTPLEGRLRPKGKTKGAKQVPSRKRQRGR